MLLFSAPGEKHQHFLYRDTCLWFVFTVIAGSPRALCAETHECVREHHRGVWGCTTGGARRQRATTRRWSRDAPAATPNPHVALWRGFTCGRQRRVTTHECRLQSSGVLSLLHLLRFVVFSLVGTSVFCTEQEVLALLSLAPAWRATISCMNSAAPAPPWT